VSSLIDQAEESKKGYRGPQEEGEPADKKLMQSSELVSIASDICGRNSIEPKQRKRWSKHRKRLHDVYWPLGSLLGKCNTKNFAGIVAASLAHFDKTCKHIQPNGEWRIFDYEVAIRDSNKGERLVMAVQFVDALNEPDLNYHNGQPAVSVNITAPGIPDELVAALKERGSGDDELKDLLKQFVGVMAKKEMSTKAAPAAAPAAPAAATVEEQA
jgi:hypothetical protein